MQRCYCAYIVASKSRCLYIGVTGHLVQRIGQHRGKLPGPKGFATLYRTSQLVYYETTSDVRAAIAREKQLKRWRRAKKVALITSANPTWRDLARAWPEIEACPIPPMNDAAAKSPPG